jgi:O-antigen/teichoic acid export membrane protein
MKNAPGHPSLKINAISNWAAFCINILVGVMLTPYIIRSIGKDDYGIWVLVGSFVGYYGLLNLGVGTALLRYVARYSAKNNEEKLNEVVSTAMAVFSLTGIVVFIASVILGPTLSEFFELSLGMRDDFVRVVGVVGLSTGISFAGSIFGTIVMGCERFILANMAGISANVLRAGLVIMFMEFNANVVGVAYATLMTTLYEIIVNAYIARHVAPNIRPSYFSANAGMLKELILFGGVATVISLADIMRSNLDHVVVAKFVGIEYVAIYGIGLLLLRYIVRIITTGMSVLTPRFAKLDGINATRNMQELFLKSLTISGFMAFGAAMCAIIFGKYVIIWWVGPEFADSATILAILSCSSAIAIAQNPAIGLMYAINKHHYYATATMIEALANLGLSIYLANIYGMLGVALGTLISMSIVKAIAMPIYVSRLIKIPWLDYIKTLLKPAVVSTVLILFSYYVGITEIEHSEILRVLIAGGIFSIAYIVLNYLVMSVDEQSLFISIVKLKAANGRIFR